MADNSANEGRVRRYLQERGGSVEDALGRGLTDQMARELGDKPAALSALLAQMESEGVITRDTRGLRTYRIALVEPDEASASEAATGGSGAASTASEIAPQGVPASGNGSDAPPEPRSMRTVRLRDALSRRATPAAETAAPGEAAAAPPGGAEAATAPSADAGAAAVGAGAVGAGADAGAGAVGAGALGAAAPEALGAPEAPAEPPNGGASNRTLSLREAIARQSGSAGTDAAPRAPASAAGASTASPTPSGAPPVPPVPSAGGASSGSGPAAPPAPADASPSTSLRARLGITDADADAGAATTTGFPARRPGRAYSSPRSFSGTATSTVPTTPTAPTTPIQASPTHSYDTITPAKPAKVTEEEAGDRQRRSRLTVVPTVRREPSRTLILGIVAAFLGIVVIAGGYYAVAHNSSSPVANQPQPAADACNIVTPAMASTLFGDDAGRPAFVLGECVYQDTSAIHELLVEDYHDHEPQVYASTHTAAAQDIPNLGTAAYFVGGSLWVVDGTNIMELTLADPTSTGAPPSTPSAALLNLARQALPALVNHQPGS